MTTRKEFFNLHDQVPVFALTKDITVMSYFWELGSAAYMEPRRLKLKKGTKLIRSSYSAFDNGHSMRVIRNCKNHRWFEVPYDSMKHVGWTSNPKPFGE